MWKAKANFFMSIIESAKGNRRLGKTVINLSKDGVRHRIRIRNQ